MFGCCNSIFSSSCRCRCGSSCGSPAPSPAPTPVFPPVTPPVPPILRGMQLSLTRSSGGSVAEGASVPFDTVDVNNTLGVSSMPGSGFVTLSRAGTYLVNWWVALENAQEAESVVFALKLNGNVVQTSYSDIGGGQIYGTAIVTVSSVPSVLMLTNGSDGAITYATAAGQAGLTITQFA